MDIQSTSNPYRYLASSVRSLLRNEVELSAPDRESKAWMLFAYFAGTQVMVGKGHVNTLFWTFGKKGERAIGYPNDALILLDRLGKQRHVLYYLYDRSGTKQLREFDRQKILAAHPEKGDVIAGIAVDGHEDELYKAKINISGKIAWIRKT